jgi:parvulin-like peptidyl-prolyl isomerase
MLKRMREGGAYFIKGVMVVVVVTFIATIFVVWGVKSMPGDLARRGIVASVAGAEISTEDYQRALRQQIEMFRRMLGDKFDENVLESMNIKEQVLEQMIRRILVLQYAERHGISVAPEELAEEIRRFPAFGGKDGFSRQRYLQVLQANRLAPERFETDLRREMIERKIESLVRGAVRVSADEVRDGFQRLNRRLTVEVVQLPTGDEGKKLADTITVAIGQGKSLADAAKAAGVSPRTFGPFPAMAPPGEIQDPGPFRQAVDVLKPGETSPLVTGPKASYLVRLVREQDPPQDDFDKEKAIFQDQLLLQKRAEVFSDWLRQLRAAARVTVEREGL